MASDVADGQTLEKVKRFIRTPDIPTVIMYGDSYLTHLKTWLKRDAKYTGPRFLDKKVSKKTHFIAVGGSNFSNVHDRVTGVKVPDTQRWMGNIWRYTIKVKEVNPNFVVLNLGANDCDTIDYRLKDAIDDYRFNGAYKKPEEVSEFKRKFIQDEMKQLYKNLDRVTDRLKKQFPEARFIFVGIVRRAWWGESARMCAQNIEWWCKRKLGYKVVQIAGFVDPVQHLCNDEVHLNYLGNRLYMDKVFSRIIQVWMAKEMHGEK